MVAFRHLPSLAACGRSHWKLRALQVWLVSEQKQVPITSLWDERDRAFLVFARSMGCNFCQVGASGETLASATKFID